MNNQRTIYLLFFSLVLTIHSNAQDVEHLWSNFTNHFKQEPIKLNGSFSSSQILYGIRGIDPRRDPYTYFLNASINVSIYGWSIPFSASYSNEQFKFNQTLHLMPLNQFGFTPYYKWAKFYVGYRSMSFSPYTINGKTFYGVGVELSPGIFRFSAMYGKLQNAVEIDSTITKPAYKRLGYAVKFGVEKGGDFANFVVFAARDDSSSLPVYSRTDDVKPMQNLIFNVNLGKRLFDKLSFSFSLAGSALSRDLYSEPMTAGVPPVYRLSGFLMPNLTSTIYSSAIKSNLTYSEKKFSVGLAYEKVDPEYMTLGAYYFNNDFENLTVNTNVKFMNNKLNLALNIGGQRNNLQGDKLSENKRLVSSANLSYAPSEKWNMSLTYSNFSSYTYIHSEFDELNRTDPYADLDTMNFTQITQNAGMNMFFILGDPKDKTQRKSLSLNLNYQQAAETQSDYNNNAGSSFYNGNVSFLYNLTSLNLSVVTSMAANYTSVQQSNSVTLGPSLSVGKSFFEKSLKTVFTTAYNNSYSNNLVTSKILSFRINSTYVLKKKHNFSLNMIFINRFGIERLNVLSFQEFTGTLNYSFTF